MDSYPCIDFDLNIYTIYKKIIPIFPNSISYLF